MSSFNSNTSSSSPSKMLLDAPRPKTFAEIVKTNLKPMQESSRPITRALVPRAPMPLSADAFGSSAKSNSRAPFPTAENVSRSTTTSSPPHQLTINEILTREKWPFNPDAKPFVPKNRREHQQPLQNPREPEYILSSLMRLMDIIDEPLNNFEQTILDELLRRQRLFPSAAHFSH